MKTEKLTKKALHAKLHSAGPVVVYMLGFGVVIAIFGLFMAAIVILQLIFTFKVERDDWQAARGLLATGVGMVVLSQVLRWVRWTLIARLHGMPTEDARALWKKSHRWGGPPRITGREGALTLYRAVDSTELAQIEQLGWKAFPETVKVQPTLILATSRKYAREMARCWFTDQAADRKGHVVKLTVAARALAGQTPQVMGGSDREEYWVPTTQLDRFIAALEAPIEWVATYDRRSKASAK